MEKHLKVQEQYRSLDKMLAFVKQSNEYQCSEVWNIWEVPSGNEMQRSILVKKNSMIGIKLDFIKNDTLKIMPVVPSKFLVSFTVGRGFGPPLVRALLYGGQKKIFEEVRLSLQKIEQ